jgi:hypothetical protein
MKMQEEFEDAPTERIDGGSVTDPANFQTIMLIMLNRIYDVQMAFLMSINPEKAMELYAMHEAGDYLAPPPAVAIE